MLNPDITVTQRSILQRVLEGTLTELDRESLQASISTPIQHDPRECLVCVHEAATGVPPLVAVLYDPIDKGLSAIIDEGQAQGDRCGRMLQTEFDTYPKAREYARAIARALGPTEPAHTREVLVALAGAIHRIVKSAWKGTL